MICWHCYWGVPKPVADIFNKALAALGGDENPLHYGPAHIVWADENLNRSSVQWCLDHFAEYKHDYGEASLAVVRTSLEELLALPDDVLEPEPADYDGEHPENYPPPVGMEMVHI